jgi:2-oxoglutarate/2-oxoacid ferredoxin oxidoreductase subunit alpha
MQNSVTASRVICFAGDSGDGVQVLGQQFATLAAVQGDHVMTFADFPAEIRAPRGTVGGVSSYQVHMGRDQVRTTGEQIDVLVALNPAAVRLHSRELAPRASLIIDQDAFGLPQLSKAGYSESPLPALSEQGYSVIALPLTQLTRECLKSSDLDRSEKDRCRNFYALGVIAWMLRRSTAPTEAWIAKKFAAHPRWAAANQLVLTMGFRDAVRYVPNQETATWQPPAPDAGTYRYLTGNEAVALALAAVGVRSGRSIVYGSYPITPASDILHALARMQHMPILTFQAEDEIAAIGAALGASYAGAMGVTATSGPGLSLKGEFLGLAVMSELPLVLIDVQRAGPSTGMPTKMEQGDLWQALYGRHGDSPLVVLAARSPAHCFTVVYEACRLAMRYRTPVIVLSDASLAGGSEVWAVPDPERLPTFAEEEAPLHLHDRDPETLAKAWVVPGTKGFEHCSGGLEQEDQSGRISYDAQNHEQRTLLRRDKILGVRSEALAPELWGPREGEVLVISWGSTFGAARQAVETAQLDGQVVAHLQLDMLWPLDAEIARIGERFKQWLVPEVNSGQLPTLLQARFARPVHSLARPMGSPLSVGEIRHRLEQLIQRGSKS